MKFGHASDEQLDQITFDLPPDHQESMTKGVPESTSSDFNVFVGCGKWGIPKWVGPVYPSGTKQKDFLEAYISKFNAIELNGTFYRLSRSSIEKWAEAAKETNFQYCPKWSQRITHFKRLHEVDENITYFIESMAMLGDNLGCSFMTLPPNFGPKHLERVHSFLQKVPQGYPMAIEFRHKDWFTEEVFSQVVEALKKREISLAITDVALRRDALHMCVTASNVFIRFNGYGLHKSDFQRLDDWIPRLNEWRNAGVENVYFFMHQANEEHTPVLVDYFSKEVNKALNLSLPTLDL